MPKSKYKASIMQNKIECYLCHAPMSKGLEVHHAIPGNGNRKICTEFGLWIYCCPKCHRNLHDHGVGYKEVQADAQRAFIKDQKKKGLPESVARDMWYSKFLKFYDEEGD